jgi:tetratricopeptide (TPR) repeat protein
MRAVKFVAVISACSVLVFCSVGTLAVAEDASIDRLLNKLPPPEKLIKPSVQKALEQPDAALKDSLVTEIVRAAMTRNFSQVLNLSRKLTERYPRSAGALCLRGVISYDLRQYGEASASFRTAAEIQPAFAFAHFGMAAVQVVQGHYASAIPHLQRVTELEPKAAVVYYYLSDCMLRAARKQESADYARKAAALPPADVDMWVQLAKAEKALGHSEAIERDRQGSRSFTR